MRTRSSNRWTERTWFRYHRLFADLLRLELRRRLPDQVPTLRRAAGWFTVQGEVAEAVRQTQAAGDWLMRWPGCSPTIRSA
jgi:LuxR family maltose regulon positive regulatory protein